jgi:hypothetical protein
MINAIEAPTDAPTGVAAYILRVHPATLVAMGQRGEIRYSRTASGRYRWDVREYLQRRQQNPKAL